MKFQATIVIVVQGEAEVTADALNVYTKPDMTIIPTIMWDSTDPSMTQEESKMMSRVVAHNIVHRASSELQIKGVTEGVPMPIVGDVPPKERS